MHQDSTERKPFMRTPVLTVLILSCLFAGTPASATLIVLDRFSTDAASVQNKAVESPQTPGDLWSNTSQGANGRTQVTGGKLVMGVNAGGSGAFSKAAAPFDDALVPGFFRMSFTLGYDATPDRDNRIVFYGGLGNSTGDGSTFVDNQLALGFRIHPDPAYDLTDPENDGIPLKAGIGASPGNLTTTIFPVSGDIWAVALAITYDPATDLAEFFVDGGSIGTVSYSGDIGGLWFKGDQMNHNSFTVDSGVLIDNVMVVPEPSTLALGLSMLAFLAFMRRRRK